MHVVDPGVMPARSTTVVDEDRVAGVGAVRRLTVPSWRSASSRTSKTRAQIGSISAVACTTRVSGETSAERVNHLTLTGGNIRRSSARKQGLAFPDFSGSGFRPGPTFWSRRTDGTWRVRAGPGRYLAPVSEAELAVMSIAGSRCRPFACHSWVRIIDLAMPLTMETVFLVGS